MDGTCNQGHPQTEENTYQGKHGKSRCRLCVGRNADPFEELPEPVISARRPRPRVTEVVDMDPAPFAVPVPMVAKVRSGRQAVTVWLSDTHIPFHDPRALEVVHGIIRDVRPTRIIHGGDWMDCYTISRFDRDPTHLFTLNDEIAECRRQMGQLAQLAPDAERWWLEGNHEHRLTKVVWTLPDTARELARLPEFNMMWPRLTKCEEVGWQFVPAAKQSTTEILPGIITKHGSVVRKWSAATAKGEWERYGKSGISGHTHRLGQFYTNDFNGSHLWVEGGCTCDTHPEYVEDPNWQQGCVVIEHSADNKRFAMHMVYIQDGRAIWRGMDYRAAA